MRNSQPCFFFDIFFRSRCKMVMTCLAKNGIRGIHEEYVFHAHHRARHLFQTLLENGWKPHLAFSFFTLILSLRVGLGVRIVDESITEEDESETDFGSGANVSPRRKIPTESYTAEVGWEIWMLGFPSEKMRESTEMLVVMEMVGQHVITVHKNSNMGALRVCYRVEALWR